MIWSPSGDQCLECATNERPHKSRGLCARCYGRLRYQGRLPQTVGPTGEEAPWSHYCEACLECGTTDRPHKTRGLCGRCHGRLQYQGKLPPRKPRPLKARPNARLWWSQWTTKCVECGTNERRHGGYGYCQACYSRHRRAKALPSVPAPTWAVGGRSACANCGTSQREHSGHGLCSRCYMNSYYASAAGRKVMRACALRYCATPQGKRGRRESARRRRDRKQAVQDVVPAGYEALVFELFGHSCIRCGSLGPLELDHHVPLFLGRGLLHNAVPLCVHCNRSKHSRAPETFYDAWKLAEIRVLLWETRETFHNRFVQEVERGA